MLKIAHISDPHVNERFHPEHFDRLRAVLVHALEVQHADHIVLTGDLTSNADERDLIACRNLFRELGILNAERLSLVVGNHDIFGGPHLADELLQFPSRCSNRDYEHFLSRFYDAFSETFAGNDGPDKSPFPYAKLIGNVALIGLNSVARHSSLKNPVGSNGRISEREMKEYAVLLNDNEIKHCDHRIVMVHHHLFRRKDESKLHTPPETNMIVERIEQATLKLRGKRKFLKTLNEGKVGMVLHGHVHFTAGYVRKGITCLNGAGSVYPVNPIEELKYNLITVDKKTITHKVIVVGKEFLQAAALMEHDSQLPTALQLVKVA